MAESIGSATTFVIQEVGNDGKPKADGKSVSLAGRALPYRPITLKGKQRIETTWYPGSPVASTQVFGSEEAPTTIKGMWKQRFLGTRTAFGVALSQPEAVAKVDGNQVTEVVELVQACDKIRQRGQLVQVSWNHIARYAIVTDFEQSWDRAEDVEWSMELTWISSSKELPEAPTFGKQFSFLNWAADMETQVQQFAQLLQAPFQAANEFNEAIAAIGAAMEDRLTDAQVTTANVVNTVYSPLDGIQRALGLLESVKEGAAEIIGIVTERPAVEYVSPEEPDSVPFGQELLVEAHNRNLLNAARAQKSFTTSYRDEMRKQVDPEVIYTFVASDGQDLRDVSMFFFGTPSEWQRIMEFNNLPGSLLQRGQLVFVPKLSRSRA